MRVLLLLLLAASALGFAPTRRASRVRTLCSLRGGAAVEHTFAMLKPDVAGDESTVTAIKAQIKQAGLTIEREERCRLSRRECEAFYAEHRERAFFRDLVGFMSSGPVVKLELSGPNAIKTWRELIGPTNSGTAREQAPSSVRVCRLNSLRARLLGALYANDRRVLCCNALCCVPLQARFGSDQQRNAAHGSDGVESAQRELGMMFKETK